MYARSVLVHVAASCVYFPIDESVLAAMQSPWDGTDEGLWSASVLSWTVYMLNKASERLFAYLLILNLTLVRFSS